MGNTVGFIWVPAHTGIERNEEADEIAKKKKKKLYTGMKLNWN